MYKILLGTVLLIFLLNSCANKGKVQKPNIIFIMSDDHTSQAFGIYGSRLAHLNPTPTLDKIAREGIIFDNAFCNNSICTPSRASIITGQYPQTNGVLDLDGNIPPEKQFLPIEMKKLGYQTAMVGKWHLKQEPAAFDFYTVLPGQGKYYNPDFRVRGENNWPENIIQMTGHSSDCITDISLDWIKNKRDKSKPFFMMHHYKAPHDMFKFAERYSNYLEDTYIPEPASMYYRGNNGSVATRGENDVLIQKIGSSIGHRNVIRNMGMHMGIDPNIPDPEYTHLAYQEYLKRYLRCVKGVDDNLERLFAYLKEEGILDKTIIIYTGDQGFYLGEHDFIDKRWMYEESMRMPFFVRYPEKIEAGIRTDAIINNTDYAPTIIELAGGTVPDYMQGKSFKTILETGEEPEGWQQSTYYRYWMHMAHRHANPAHFGIRTKNYKLIFFYGKFWKDFGDGQNKESRRNNYDFETPAAWEFYDLKKDPMEMQNEYANPEYAKIIAQIKNELTEKRRELNEEDTNFPHIQEVIDAHWDD
ncbi:MAG: sulfatase [Prolixibacteraceae bacterium]|jgi:N-acetylglucosamine-6-sulfatase|nr:sulfatase [Prolixibacteraceae bacterium]MBT6004253.1 sulfatase [Prolixibacteraceae bacterium]MBT6766183.1 sulfatase [Prolixibacteraceae bacterium]MBT7000584.1 sulfatase [Prolixibacteraceae bacterium]MBT7396929.1 sulfatase [Prolixibacteraceae bacterium]